MDCAQPAPRKALGEYQIEEQVRAALSHQFPDGGFDQVVREVFKLVLERDRKRKALTYGSICVQQQSPGAQER
jgi:hypothetical protein